MSENKTVSVVSFSGQPQTEHQRHLPPDRLIKGNPFQTIHAFFEDQGGDLVAGTWTSTPGKWQAFENRDEFCYIVDGHVCLTDADGVAREYRTGDAFLIPNGFKGTWEVFETTTKHYVIRNHKQA